MELHKLGLTASFCSALPTLQLVELTTVMRMAAQIMAAAGQGDNSSAVAAGRRRVGRRRRSAGSPVAAARCSRLQAPLWRAPGPPGLPPARHRAQAVANGRPAGREGGPEGRRGLPDTMWSAGPRDLPSRGWPAGHAAAAAAGTAHGRGLAACSSGGVAAHSCHSHHYPCTLQPAMPKACKAIQVATAASTAALPRASFCQPACCFPFCQPALPTQSVPLPALHDRLYYTNALV